MSKPSLILDSFSIPKSTTSWKIDESQDSKVVDGVNILARAVGPFFVTDANSLNNRHYSKKLWERAINENNDRLDNGEMLGTIGHDQPLDDQALLEGKVSHKVTKLWIDESTGAGMGEIQVLSTPAGKVLNSLLRGGVRLKVSSRALGEFNGKTKDGAQMIDENTFDLQGFDFVQKPGVPTAVPVLVESDQTNNENHDDTNTSTRNEQTMSQDLLESLAQDKMNLTKKLDEALGTLNEATREKAALQHDLEARQREVARLEESANSSNAKVTELESKVADLQNEAKAFESIGSSTQVTEALDKLEERLAKYNELGTYEELTQAFDRVNQLVEDYNDLGSPDELEATLAVVEAFADMGTVDEITAKLDTLKKFESLGSQEELSKVLDLMEEYVKLGSPADINQAFNMTESIVSKYQTDAKKKDANDLANKFAVKLDVVESMLGKYSKEDTEKMLEAIRGDDVSNRYRANRTAPKDVNENVDSLNEDDRRSTVSGGTRTSRLMEQLSH